jgi:hypothetical protein
MQLRSPVAISYTTIDAVLDYMGRSVDTLVAGTSTDEPDLILRIRELDLDMQCAFLSGQFNVDHIRESYDSIMARFDDEMERRYNEQHPL